MDRKDAIYYWKLCATHLNRALYYISSILSDFSHFFSIVVSPIPVIGLLLIWYLTVLLPDKPSVLQTLIIIVITILSGFVGTILYERYKKEFDTDFIIKKSNSSIRNLKLMKAKISTVLERLALLKKTDNSRDIDELESHIKNIDKDILNSISDWEDVNPDSAKLIVAFENIESYERQLKQLQIEKTQLSEQLGQAATQDKAELTKTVAKLTSEIKELHREINNLENITTSYSSISPSKSSWGLDSPGTYWTPSKGDTGVRSFISKVCSSCGRYYTPGVTIPDNGLCPSCNSIAFTS